MRYILEFIAYTALCIAATAAVGFVCIALTSCSNHNSPTLTPPVSTPYPIPTPIALPGATGPQGATGVVGPIGPPGPSGVNGTVGQPIELCGACEASYPQTFPEYGLCINNNLYGVYSQNGGFLSILPPGAYSSDGINCSCAFTIGADCAVTDE
jgi:hypothetical protein